MTDEASATATPMAAEIAISAGLGRTSKSTGAKETPR